jgi:hypothetical protein
MSVKHYISSNMNQNSAQSPVAQAQQQPRLPKVSPQVFEAFNKVDGWLGSALLNRQQHSEAAQTMQALLRYVEGLEQQVADLTAKASQSTDGAPAPSA